MERRVFLLWSRRISIILLALIVASAIAMGVSIKSHVVSFSNSMKQASTKEVIDKNAQALLNDLNVIFVVANLPVVKQVLNAFDMNFIESFLKTSQAYLLERINQNSF